MPTDPAAPVEATTALTSAAAPDAAEVKTLPSSGIEPGKVEAVAPDAAKVAADAKVVAAAEIVLKVPEGINPKDPQLEAFRGVAKELGLKSEQAQKIADLYFGAQKSAAENALNSETAQKAWGESLKSDKEFGGTSLGANLKIAQRAVEKYATPEFKTFLNDTGLGDHPELVRVFVRIGKAIAEDSITGTGTPAPDKSKSDAAFLRDMYPNTKTPGFHKE